MKKLYKKCKCGKMIKINNNPDGWYVLEDVDWKYGCGHWECGFNDY